MHAYLSDSVLALQLLAFFFISSLPPSLNVLHSSVSGTVQYLSVWTYMCFITVATCRHVMNVSHCLVDSFISGNVGTIAAKICKQIHPHVPSVNLRASIHVFLCQLDSTASVSFLLSLILHGNRPSLFLMIYPCHVLDEPPGMPLLRFARYDGLAGRKTQARFGKGRYRPERDDGKGLE